jgi:uncharacterized protein (DUF1697 family)
MPTSYVALLRGINVGGKNMLPMKRLAELFTAAGCDDVRTYIQSGNVIFRATPDVAVALPEIISARILEDFGIRVPVVLRSSEQLAETIRDNPFLPRGVDPETLHVLFLTDQPGSGLIEKLNPSRSPPDEFIALGGAVYLHLPNGVARTKLTNAYFDTTLKTIGTQRNWRTVTKLFTMMAV